MERSLEATYPGTRKRLVIVAENLLSVDPILVGLRNSGEFNLVGYAHVSRTSARVISSAGPDAVLVEDGGESEAVVTLIRELRACGLVVIALSGDMAPERLELLFHTGAIGAFAKATHPRALVTLLRETLSGHVFHSLEVLQADSDEIKPDARLPHGILTAREIEILQLVAAGSKNSDVAARLWITEQTVKFHLRNIYRKIEVANRTEASHFAHVNGLVARGSALAAAS